MAVAPSKARTGFGSKFACAASAAALTAGGAGVDWAEVTALTPPSDTADTEEVTHMESPDARREWIKTLIDSGEADIECNLVAGSATDLAMQAAMLSPDAYYYKMAIPAAERGKFWVITGLCLITGYTRGTPIAGKMTGTARLKFTGTRTEAASV